MTRISFIMPTFNRAHLIEESLQSILPQMGGEDELLVVIDGSTDSTAQVLAPFGDRIRVLTQDNQGKSAALNHGLRETCGAYVWICDDDDVLCPEVVEPMVHAIEQRGDDIVFGKYDRFSLKDSTAQSLGTGYWPDLGPGSLQRHILEDCFVMQNATLARRAAYENVGPFDESLPRSIDYDMAIRLLTECSASFVDRTIYRQREHDGARGPQAERHAAGESETVWRAQDAEIFARLRERLPLSYYESMFEQSDAGLVRRAALLQRGCVMARHHLWQAALEDFDAAAATRSPQALGVVEQDICRRVTGGKFGLSGAIENSVVTGLRSLAETSRAGQQIVHNILRGALWRLRADDPQAREDARQLITAVAGTGGLFKLSAEHILKKILPSGDNGLTERNSIAPLGNVQ